MSSTGELIDTETVTISSEEGRWKRAEKHLAGGLSYLTYGSNGGIGETCRKVSALILPTYLTPTAGSGVAFEEPSLGELARVIKAGACIEASFQRGKGEVGMDE